MPDILLNISLFLAGVLVSYFFFRRGALEGRKSESLISDKVTHEGKIIRVRVDLFEQRLQSVLATMNLSLDTKRQLEGIFDDVQFIEIIEAVDRNGTRKSGDEQQVKELTKDILFFIIREIYYFPFSQYQKFVPWLKLRGYEIPDHLTFQNSYLYEKALTKVEKLNKVGIGAGKVDAKLLFSSKRPFRV